MSENRVIIIVLDSAGIGEAPDAEAYGDVGVNTLEHVAEAVGGLSVPNMARLGLGNIHPLKGVLPEVHPTGCWGKMQEASAGKDTITGHWEIAGLITEDPFPLYPHGFPPEVMAAFEKAIGRGTLANFPASGTEIILKYGDEHVITGKPIVYTSGDSCFQIAAHEAVIPVEELYRMCQIAREILQGEHAVGRVIARPFIGETGTYERTDRRKDYPLPPHGETLLDAVTAAGLPVIAIGKISDIFAERGVTTFIHTESDAHGMRETIQAMKTTDRGLIFTNLVGFDTLYGHRNDPLGYAHELQEFDSQLPEVLNLLDEKDILIITADHGCDPTTPGTDHTREYVPVIATYRGLTRGRDIGVRSSFCDIAATIRAHLSLGQGKFGESFLGLM